MRIEDATDLAGFLLGDESLCDDEGALSEALENEFSVDMETFEILANALLRLTPTLVSPLTDEPMHSFGRSYGTTWVALMRCKVQSV